jgi:hypothetical protein
MVKLRLLQRSPSSSVPGSVPGSAPGSVAASPRVRPGRLAREAAKQESAVRAVIGPIVQTYLEVEANAQADAAIAEPFARAAAAEAVPVPTPAPTPADPSALSSLKDEILGLFLENPDEKGESQLKLLKLIEVEDPPLPLPATTGGVRHGRKQKQKQMGGAVDMNAIKLAADTNGYPGNEAQVDHLVLYNDQTNAFSGSSRAVWNSTADQRQCALALGDTGWVTRTCWLCGSGIKLQNNGIQVVCGDDSNAECEHVLPVNDMFFLGFLQNQALLDSFRRSPSLSSFINDKRRHFYDAAHSLCNNIKSNGLYIQKIGEGPYEPNVTDIMVDIINFIVTARKHNTEFVFSVPLALGNPDGTDIRHEGIQIPGLPGTYGEWRTGQPPAAAGPAAPQGFISRWFVTLMGAPAAAAPDASWPSNALGETPPLCVDGTPAVHFFTGRTAARTNLEVKKYYLSSVATIGGVRYPNLPSAMIDTAPVPPAIQAVSGITSIDVPHLRSWFADDNHGMAIADLVTSVSKTGTYLANRGTVTLDGNPWSSYALLNSLQRAGVRSTMNRERVWAWIVGRFNAIHERMTTICAILNTPTMTAYIRPRRIRLRINQALWMGRVQRAGGRHRRTFRRRKGPKKSRTYKKLLRKSRRPRKLE